MSKEWKHSSKTKRCISKLLFVSYKHFYFVIYHKVELCCIKQIPYFTDCLRKFLKSDEVLTLSKITVNFNRVLKKTKQK